MIEYRELLPPASLRPFLECLWFATGDAPDLVRAPQRIVPDGCPELIVQLGERFERRVNGRWRAQPARFVAGTLTAPWWVRPTGPVSTLGARFRAGAIRALLPIDLVAGVDRETPLEAIVGRAEDRRLARQIELSADDAERLSVLGDWLAARLGERGWLLATRDAVGAIVRSRGRCRIEPLGGPTERERRALQREFRRELGISPKRFARIVRLSALLAKLGESERDSAVDLALELGYFDQAHMLRDVRLLAGRKLRSPRAADGALGAAFTEPERLRRMLVGAFADPE